MRKRLGFSLMEMLVIVGAIGVLTAIAFPAVDRGFEQTRESADIAAMQSADALMTSAALTGKTIGGYPASAYTQAQPLYYDGNGSLTPSCPAPYGQGTAKSGGKSWSACTDGGAYNPQADYTQSVVCCWFDSDTRRTHVHWVGSDGSGQSSRPQSSGKSDPIFPTFDPRPTEPGQNPGTGGTPGGGGTPPEPVPGVHSHAYLTYEEWKQQWLKVSILPGHRYCYEGKLYLAVEEIPVNGLSMLPPDNPDWFIPLKAPNTVAPAPGVAHPWVLYASKNVRQDSGSLCFSDSAASASSMELITGDYFIDDTQTPWKIYALRQSSSGALAPTGVYHETFHNLWVEFTRECQSEDGFSCCLTKDPQKQEQAFNSIADPAPFLTFTPSK